MEQARLVHSLTDDELLRRVIVLTAESRSGESELVAHLAEVDARKLFARESCATMFGYCTTVLHLSESEAFLRIRAARASRRFPLILTMLGDGRLHLSGIAILVPHLTIDNAAAVLTRATHKTKRQVAELIAALRPNPTCRQSSASCPQPLAMRPIAQSQRQLEFRMALKSAPRVELKLELTPRVELALAPTTHYVRTQ